MESRVKTGRHETREGVAKGIKVVCQPPVIDSEVVAFYSYLTSVKQLKSGLPISNKNDRRKLCVCSALTEERHVQKVDYNGGQSTARPGWGATVTALIQSYSVLDSNFDCQDHRCTHNSQLSPYRTDGSSNYEHRRINQNRIKRTVIHGWTLINGFVRSAKDRNSEIGYTGMEWHRQGAAARPSPPVCSRYLNKSAERFGKRTVLRAPHTARCDAPGVLSL
ncbi:hypothetical protein EVAR_81355_1 [Eumeta japonica]|uniref:Uncharacterized protein n=1 Tax=Eumeta variegata TaxID=151549 RepID=A0A4C1XCW6_EUMVA|nr:hypothetical protein EVAR_81355_1 [Eumeta japonica]